MIFKTIQEAINYVQYCPVCHSRLEMRNNGLDKVPYARFPDDRAKVICWGGQDFDIEIDYNTEEIIELKIRDNSYQPINTFGNPLNVYWKSPPIIDGLFYNSFSVECIHCIQYHYVVKVLIDIRNIKIIHIELNSETLTIDEGGHDTYEIKNNYAMGKTGFQSFSANGKDEYTELPLVPLDIYNPGKTIARIKSLMLFL
jgi:hypothetical protein